MVENVESVEMTIESQSLGHMKLEDYMETESSFDDTTVDRFEIIFLEIT